jgi:hypothetical protein
VTALSEPNRERRHSLLEITRTTLRLWGDHFLALHELIAVELPDHLLLADVNHCAKHGNSYTTDAARIVTIPKTSALETASKSAKIDALIADLQLQCHLQLSMLERSLASLDLRIGKEPGLDPVNIDPEELHERPAADSSNSRVAPEKIEDAGHASNVVRAANADVTPAEESNAGEFRPDQPRLDPKTFAGHMALLSAGSSGAFSTAPASKTGPGSKTGGASKRSRRRRWSVPAGLAAALALLACSTPLMSPLHKNLSLSELAQPRAAVADPLADVAEQTPSSAMPSTPVISTPDPEPSQAPVQGTVQGTAQGTVQGPVQSQIVPSAPREVAQQVVPEVEHEVENAAGVQASIKATAASWVSVCYDGKERFQKMFAAGETREIRFSQMALVRLGNGPAMEVTLDGKPIQPGGPPGVVRAVELGRAGARFVNYQASSPACGISPDAAESAASATPKN